MSLARPFRRPQSRSRRNQGLIMSPRSRIRAIFAGLGVLACGILAYLVIKGLGVFPVSERTQRIGLFEITYKTYDAYGHRGTGRTLHFHTGGRRMLVSRELGTFEVNPANPSAILFEHCSENPRPECGIRYFDGHRKRSWKVSNEQVIRQPVDAPVSWSADGRFVVLSGEHHVHIVNLEKPTTIDVSDVLALSEGPAGRSVRFGDWSPDSRKIAVMIGHYTDPVPPFRNYAHDLVTVDVNAGTASYVATVEGRPWSELGYRWVPFAGNYVVAAVTNSRGIGWKTYRKRAEDLPPGLPQQWP
jgi:hypothetical protein